MNEPSEAPLEKQRIAIQTESGLMIFDVPKGKDIFIVIKKNPQSNIQLQESFTLPLTKKKKPRYQKNR